jgi:hypothetical protein
MAKNSGYRRMNDQATENDRDMEVINRITALLDSQFTIPGTRFRFGVDPIIGLIPGAGDALTLLISTVLVTLMAKHGASGRVVVLMLGNIILDSLIGSIPVIGQIFDFFYRANERNLNLLKEHHYKGKHQGSGTWLVVSALLIILLILSLFIYGLVELLKWIF